MLQSNGTLFTFPFADLHFQEEQNRDGREWKRPVAKGEYEGMYADEASRQLYILCKNCAPMKMTRRLQKAIYCSLMTTGTAQSDKVTLP